MGLVWLSTYIHLPSKSTIHVPQEGIIRALSLVGGNRCQGRHHYARRCSCLRAVVRLHLPTVSARRKWIGHHVNYWTIVNAYSHRDKQNKSKQFLPHQLAHGTWNNKNTCSNSVTPRCFGVFCFSKLRYLKMLIFFGVFLEMVVPAMTA